MTGPDRDRARLLPDPQADPDLPHHVRGSAVALGGAGVLILGPSGAGKSTLALHLLALGAALVGDDAVILRAGSDAVTVAPADTGPPLIEARGIGLLAAGPPVSAPLRLIVDLGDEETHRLPPRRNVPCLGRRIDLILRVPLPTLVAAIPVYLRHGRVH